MKAEIKGPLELQREAAKILSLIQGIKHKTVIMNAPPFRPGTELPVTEINYYQRGGGIGDRICQLPSLVYIAKNCPWIEGVVWATKDMFELTKNIIDQTGNPEWKVRPVEEMDQLIHPEARIRGRGYVDPQGREMPQWTNGCGGELTWLGFMDNMNKFPPPEGANVYPVIDFDKWLDKIFWTDDLTTLEYVVFTTGAISDSRKVPGHYWNPIIKYVKSKGLIPVFLGSNALHNIKETIPVKYAEGCDYGEGIDLRDKTNLMEAAWVMKNAKAVIGLDNGLIQLASCTDASIVCAYNIVHPRDRRPNRKAGKWREIFLTTEELPCTGCQSTMPIMVPHSFKACLHHDLRCIDLLFGNGGEKFIKAIDEIL